MKRCKQNRNDEYMKYFREETKHGMEVFFSFAIIE